MNSPLRIAVASGKGGTGKTTIATNLAVSLAGDGVPVAYVDCDVEEPNGHVFLKPSIQSRHEVTASVPAVDESRCTLCGACGTACRYSAIAVLPNKVLTFPKLCHSCGGCYLACPEDALREVPRTSGIVEAGVSGSVGFLQGKLAVGEPMAPPVIRAVLASLPMDHTVVLDAPPGTSCPVIEAVKTADVVLLVTEPTPFGLNDLKLAVEMVRELGLPFGVAVNRAGIGDNEVVAYCAQEKIPVLLELPNSREIAQAYSRGELAVTAVPAWKALFVGLFGTLRELAATTPTRAAVAPSPPEREPAVLARTPSESLLPGRKYEVRELVVISGKGGTGKTSIVASLFSLAQEAAVADCDVDAADLHLVLAPTVRERWPFSGGDAAVVDVLRCTNCGLCFEHCRFGAIVAPERAGAPTYQVQAVVCEGCGVCADICPERAIAMTASVNGAWFVSETRHGPMVHARLGVAQENSGKLVSLVRREAKALAVSRRRRLLLCDGSPGIGCPVIASITGASMVLVVTEPTLSGLHDLLRVVELAKQFRVKTAVCINKADINPEVCAQIEQQAAALGIPVLGRIRYDESVTAAQVKRMAVVEMGQSAAGADLRSLWERVTRELA